MRESGTRGGSGPGRGGLLEEAAIESYNPSQAAETAKGSSRLCARSRAGMDLSSSFRAVGVGCFCGDLKWLAPQDTVIAVMADGKRRIGP